MGKKAKKAAILVPWCDNVVPWCAEGSTDQITYWDFDLHKRITSPVEWRANKSFRASFKVKRFTGSTSSTQVILENTENEAHFHMRDVDFLEALSQTACVFGVLIGEWKIRKTGGKYYGLVYHGSVVS